MLRGLHLGQVNPQGIVFFGGHIGVRDIASLLNKEGIKCLIVSSSKAEVAYARRKGLDTVYADALEGTFMEDTDFSSYGYAAAVTADDHYNWLLGLRLSKIFGSAGVFMLPPSGSVNGDSHAGHLPGRLLFDAKASFDRITELYETGKIKLETLPEDVDREGLAKLFGKNFLPLFSLDSGKLGVITAGAKLEFKAGTKLIVLAQNGTG